MRKVIFLILAFFVAINLNLLAQKTIEIPDVQKPHQIFVDGNDLYIFDEADYSLHVYTLEPFALKFKIGKKGDGPHDFKYLPFVYVQPDSLAITDFLKTVFFSKDGKALKVKEYKEFADFDTNSEMLLFPVKESFVRITADHGTEKRHVFLLDSGFKTIKKLYEGPFVWRTGAPVHPRTDTLCYKDMIFISDSEKGFYWTVFSSQGKLLRVIDRSKDVDKISLTDEKEQDKDKIVDEPIYYPQLHQYCVADDKIYATTYKKKDDKRELIVLDLEGNIRERMFLPLKSIRPQRGVLRFDLFTVEQGKLYELVKKGEAENWQLVVTELVKRI